MLPTNKAGYGFATDVATSPASLVAAQVQSTYAHNDPNSAAPDVNVFFKKLIPFLRDTKGN